MASKQIAGELIVFQVREVGEVDWVSLVCTQDTTFTITNELTKTKTKCGPLGSPAIAEATVTGNAVTNPVPGATEGSYKMVTDWQKANTLLQFRYLNLVGDDFAEGAAISHFGNGYFTETAENNSAEADGFSKFSFTFDVIGELDDFDQS